MSTALVDEAAAREESLLELLRALVERESPSRDRTRILSLSRYLQDQLESRGGGVERIDAGGLGEHLLARFGSSGSGDRPLLVLGHMDTVHEAGTLTRLPFSVEADRVRGPGAYDMKGGIAVFLTALDLLKARGEEHAGELIALVTCDEEIGSPHSRPIIEELARDSRATLVLEPPLPGGGSKTRRKGVARYRLSVAGRPAHAGIEPEAGASAVHELARQVVRILDVAGDRSGTTVNVAPLGGGTASNVVAEEAWAEIDVRFWTRSEADRVDAALRSLEAVDTRCSVEARGGVNRYPLERTPESAALFELARVAAGEIGMRLDEGGTGGASDGNFTSGVGCPTLDGLGPDGGGAHSLDEHVLRGDIPRRVALVSRLLMRL